MTDEWVWKQSGSPLAMTQDLLDDYRSGIKTQVWLSGEFIRLFSNQRPIRNPLPEIVLFPRLKRFTDWCTFWHARATDAWSVLKDGMPPSDDDW